MSPEQREHAKSRFRNWRELPSERRALIRERAEIFNSLAPEEQERIRENFRRFQEMKRERREMLRERYNRMTPEQRRELHEHLERERGGRRGR
jgi:Spy/CpxP family protein refolding chaperone